MPEKGYGVQNVDSGLQVQLERDGGDSTGQSWIESNSVWPVLYWE